MKLEISPVDEGRRKLKPRDSELGFGRYFSDHMLLFDYAPGQGWHNGRIEPYRQLSLDPACMVLHYAQQIFEGFKAFRGPEGGIRLFRLPAHLQRMQRSAARMCMPAVDVAKLSQAIKELVLLDRDWVPHTEGCALYIRPNMIAIDPFLGVRPSERYLLYVITGPVGAYYPEGFDPISIMVEERYVRAIPGGAGEAKTGGNYAATLLGQEEAKKAGLTQVLWLDGKHHKYVEEVGTMNIFFLLGDEIVTSPLAGSVLAGVTRRSVLDLLTNWGEHRVSERMVTIEEVVSAARDGSLQEAFGTGTAAVISPVGSFQYRGETIQVADGKTGPLSQRLFDYLFALQYGRIDDALGWVERID